MRTTLDLPESLVEKALRVTHIKTKTALIKTTLQELVRKHKIAGIKRYKGTVDVGAELDILRDRK
jgi:Arc/MetJ family transcription regulator